LIVAVSILIYWKEGHMSKDINMPQNEFPLMEVEKGNIVLFHPNIPAAGISEVVDTLSTRWIGQGPKVEKFEKLFQERFTKGDPAIAVGSGTDALHLAYLLADIKRGDEVIVPVFTCTATNIPLLYIGAKAKFADVQVDTLNISSEHVRQLVDEKTKAIVCVHYGGLPCDMDELYNIANEYNIPVIEDAAHALGATYKGNTIGSISDFTMFSFQAIKHITTGDGGLLAFKDASLLEKSKRLRWFGIDRSAKQKGIWENDICEVGYKYQMTDIAASLGIASLNEFDNVLFFRQELLNAYITNLNNVPGIKVIGADFEDRTHAAWLCTVLVEGRVDLQKKLYERHIESAQVHYRNDRYSIFGGRRNDFANMDSIEDKYLVLPLHTKLTTEDVQYVCDTIKSGW
jgi:dTDP-4-amino-4,6-dideoxygalactose transaminase